MSDRRPITPPLPAGDQIDSPRLVLRDGTVASVRAVTAADRESIRQFFHDLSPDSRRKRFFTPAEPSDSIVERMADSSDPHRALTLIVHRLQSESLLPVAIASYMAIGPRVAEVAFAVDDRFQGKGLATLLLERLAIRAAQNGFEKFQATTLADNMPMLEVFRDSGFAIRSTNERRRRRSAIVADAVGRRGAIRGKSRSVGHGRVARADADAARGGGDRRLPRSLQHRPSRVRSASSGRIHRPDVSGESERRHDRRRPCLSLGARSPAGTDLAVVVVPAAPVLPVVDDCAAAGVKSLVIISAGFAEAGERGRALQRELVERVRNHGMRMVGPNCMGLLNAIADVRLNASFSPIMPPSGTRIAVVAERRARHRDSRARHRTAPRTVDVRQRRQQSGCFEQRPAAVLGWRRANVRHPLVSRVVRKSAALCPHRETHRPQQADCRGESRTHARGLASGSAATPLRWPRATSPSTPCSSKPA